MKLVNIQQSIRSKSENKRTINKDYTLTNLENRYKLPQLEKQVSLNVFKKPPSFQKTRRTTNSKIKLNGIELYYGSLSKPGFDGFSEKTNQDRELTQLIDNQQGIFGVLDGHGTDGDQISTFVRDYFYQQSLKEFETVDFIKLFTNAHNKVAAQSHFDSLMSGTTATLILIRDQVINCAWVGDSRAIVCQKVLDKVVAIELSNDHKPHLIKEKKRIESQGGVVNTYKLQNGQPVGPSRVYIKGASFPGLAMSRSIGDQIAGQIGVSHIPDIKQHQMTKDDKYLIIGSDGLWEFLDNNKIADMVYEFYISNDPQGACQKLVQESKLQWKKFSDGIDDITVVVIFFQFM